MGGDQGSVLDGVPPSEPAEGATLLGAWRLVREIGAGGMGTVWLAERADGVFRKQVAVKLINREVVRPDLVQRFVRERQILADLEHANICRLIDGGTAPDGRPYLVMERVEGQPLDRYLAQSDASATEIALTFIKLCDALGFAHARGVIHRDLKPSNIMVTARGEPKVLDFGIARLRGSPEPALTQTGEMALTPSYASPEQWRGDEVGPASDVFSLGVMLYEALAGTLPSMPGIKRLEERPLRNAGIDQRLREIVLRAVHDEPQGRYPSMGALGDALREYRGGGLEVNRAAGGPLRVYISCRGDVAADLELALLFYDALAKAGASVFLAPKNVVGGEGWVQAVTQAMTSSDVLLLLLSTQAVVSEFVAREVELARHINETKGQKLRVVPVRLPESECESEGQLIAEYLHDIDHVAYNGPGDITKVVDAVLGRGDSSLDAAQSSSSSVATTKSTRPREQSRTEFPGGVVDSDSPYYVSHPRLEDTCLRELAKPASLLRIKGSRQTGKTSLLKCLLARTAKTGARAVAVSLQLTDNAILADLDRFLRWLCAVTSRHLGLDLHSLENGWSDLFGSKDNCTAFFEEYLLPHSAPLVLAIDHVDRVFEHPATAVEFLSLLRAWNEMGKSHDLWRNLHLVLVYATEMYLPMSINRSPFNVGLPVSLSEWDAGIVHDLACRHGLALSDTEVTRIQDILNGHPHLTRIVLHHLANGMTLDDVLGHAAGDDGVFSDHLKSMLWQLEAHPALAEAAMLMMAAERPVRLGTELAFKLVSLGLARLTGNDVEPARPLYRGYLRERL